MKQLLYVGVWLAALSVGRAEDIMSIRQLDGGETVLSFTVSATQEGEDRSVIAGFTLPAGKGLLGPSSDPGAQSGFQNEEKTVFGVNHQPETKSSYVYLVLKRPHGELLFVSNVNETVAKLVAQKLALHVHSFLRIEEIVGRKIHFQTVDFGSPSRPSFDFWITLDETGQMKPR
jgi:hypothetical protein